MIIDHDDDSTNTSDCDKDNDSNAGAGGEVDSRFADERKWRRSVKATTMSGATLRARNEFN